MSLNVKDYKDFEGVFQVILEDGRSSLATFNLAPGKSVYGERLVKVRDGEYRLWNPHKSKLAAAILRNLPRLPIRSGSKLLYLGAASGTTVSHISDIVGAEGGVYAVEFSPRSLRELITNVSALRRNVYPILSDARRPGQYRFLMEVVDGVYCDVAQREQAKIVADNAQMFLKKGGFTLLAIKGRSIKSTGDLTQVFEKEIAVLKRRGFKVEKTVSLNPYDRAHVMALSKYQP
ncbi:MAG: fibrillarin-like rRNA/tRNA 2'-O-methyltransferase [Candidatus Bathyarchaeota archaeon]|nr:fibrillarin-like rRNA/tRNA 2'-O-methyltransferase [Candidatus Bathyarchaeota archaeon]